MVSYGCVSLKSLAPIADILMCEKEERQSCHIVPIFYCEGHIQLLAWELRLCVCLSIVDTITLFLSVSIPSLTFDASHLFTLALPGLLWKRGLSAEFPPKAKLVITFPGCHHSIAIHHYLELFGYIQPSDGDRHC